MSSLAYYERSRQELIDEGKNRLIENPLLTNGQLKQGPYLKNFYYYQNQENSWNDKYRLPVEKRKVNGERLDLDAYAEKQLSKTISSEKAMERSRMNTMKQFRENQLMHIRENHLITFSQDYSRGGGGYGRPLIKDRFREKYIVKDSAYYNNLSKPSWDYTPLIPPKQLKHLYTEKILDLDRNARDIIDQRMIEAQISEEGYDRWHQIMKEKTQQQLDYRTALRETCERAIIPDKPVLQSLPKEYHFSERTKSLSLPKSLPNESTLNKWEYTGLIEANPDYQRIIDAVYQRKQTNHPTLDQIPFNRQDMAYQETYTPDQFPLKPSTLRTNSDQRTHDTHKLKVPPPILSSTGSSIFSQKSTDRYDLFTGSKDIDLKYKISLPTKVELPRIEKKPISSPIDSSGGIQYVQSLSSKTIKAVPSYWENQAEKEAEIEVEGKKSEAVYPFLVQSYQMRELPDRFMVKDDE